MACHVTVRRREFDIYIETLVSLMLNILNHPQCFLRHYSSACLGRNIKLALHHVCISPSSRVPVFWLFCAVSLLFLVVFFFLFIVVHILLSGLPIRLCFFFPPSFHSPWCCCPCIVKALLFSFFLSGSAPSFILFFSPLPSPLKSLPPVVLPLRVCMLLVRLLTCTVVLCACVRSLCVCNKLVGKTHLFILPLCLCSCSLRRILPMFRQRRFSVIIFASSSRPRSILIALFLSVCIESVASSLPPPDAATACVLCFITLSYVTGGLGKRAQM